VTAAKVLREQFQRPRATLAADDGMVRHLTDYDRAFGLTDAGLGDSLAAGSLGGAVNGPVDGEEVA
jgi:hypothetical protein